MAKRKKNAPTNAAVTGRLGTERFTALIARGGGAMRNKAKSQTRSVANRRAIAED